MMGTFKEVTIESNLTACVFASARYDEKYTSDAKSKATVAFEDCTFTQNGTVEPTDYKWCECLAAVAAGNVVKFDGGTYTFAGKSHGFYTFSSNGGFIIEDGTFIDNSSDHAMFQLAWAPNGKDSTLDKSVTPNTSVEGKKTYNELYGFIDKPFAQINGGEFVGEQIVLTDSTVGTIGVTSGIFSANVAETVKNNYITDNTVEYQQLDGKLYVGNSMSQMTATAYSLYIDDELHYYSTAPTITEGTIKASASDTTGTSVVAQIGENKYYTSFPKALMCFP